jgi:hypothetical protein
MRILILIFHFDPDQHPDAAFNKGDANLMGYRPSLSVF